MTGLIVFTRDALVYATLDKKSPYNIRRGVSRKLANLRLDGWNITIASNEGVGYWEQSTACNLSAGAQFKVKAEHWFCDEVHTAKQIDRGRGGVLRVQAHNQTLLFGPQEPVLMCNKTIASTTAEIQFIANLCGISDAVFCPVIDGGILYALAYDSGRGWRSTMIMQKESWKPGPGMLDYLKNLNQFRPRQCVLVGEDANDYTAADRARFRFIYSEDWRSDRASV